MLANDTDPEGTALTAVLVDDATHGTLALAPDGGFTYIPDANFNGEDTFTYKATDGALESNTATVTITVSPVNDAPVAIAETHSIDEDTTLTVPAAGVLANDSDPEGTALTAVLVDDATHGTLVLAPDGGFTYTPDVNFNGEDSFSYKATDGTLESNTAIVTITVSPVNDAPVAIAETHSIDEDTTLTVPAAGVLANDTDPEGTALTAVLVDDATHGTLALAPDGGFTYIPDANFNGEDTFTYKATDGALESNTATVTITVSPVNDAPVAIAETHSIDEDTTLTVPAAGVLANDSDPEGTALTAVLVDDATHGTLALAPDGGFTYTPDANFNGEDSFTYKATDGALESNTATVTITVSPVNDAPVAIAETHSIDEDTTLTVPAAGVLANDTDPEGTALTAVLVDRRHPRHARARPGRRLHLHSRTPTSTARTPSPSQSHRRHS